MSTATEHTAPTAHHALSPSKFPAWAECACFEAGPAGEAAERGGMLHERLARHLHGRPDPFAGLESGDREALEWAAETIRELCEGMASGGVELRLTYKRGGKGKPVFFGTADCVGFDPDGTAATIIDFKSGEVRNHRHQLAAYAAALMSEHPEIQTVVAWLLFGRFKKAWSFTFTREEAVEIVEGIIARRTDPERQPAPCDACSWCASRLTCPALMARAVVVAENREDWKGELPAEWHASAITDPEQMARALALARFVGEWADAVQHHATELAKGGAEIPGWKLQERRGRKEVADIAEAWNLIDGTLEQPAFLRCCSLSLPKLAEAVAVAGGIPKARAEGEVAETLRQIVTDAGGPGSVAAYVEQVGGFVRTEGGQPGSAMFKFGRGYGFILGALAALCVPVELVTPQRWQKGMAAGVRGGLSKADWKRKLKAHAERLHPGRRVTLATADALLIHAWARRAGGGGHE